MAALEPEGGSFWTATKIAASFRVSLTALVPKQPDHRLALAWLRFHAALRRTWKQDVATTYAG